MIPDYSQKVASLTEVKDEAELKAIRDKATDKAVCLLFWASWHEPCNIIKGQLEEMPSHYSRIVFTWVSIDALTPSVMPKRWEGWLRS